MNNRIIGVLLLLFCLAGCKECDVPHGDANCQLPLYQYPNLSTVGGYEYIVGGYQGVVVIRTSLNEYRAYERTCPHDNGRLEISTDYGSSLLECPLCHSCYNVYSDGMPLEGSLSSCPPFQYPTVCDGGTLYISNW